MAVVSTPSAPAVSLNWTSVVFGALAFAFLFFVTVRGDLAKFLGIFGLSGTQGAGAQGGTLGNITGSGQGSSLFPNVTGSGSAGQLGNITGASIGNASVPNYSGGIDTGFQGATGSQDTGWYSPGGVDSGLAGSTGPLDTGWMTS